MPKGKDTRYHPGRQVGPHLSQHWRPTTAITGPLGAVTQHIPDPDDSGITMAAWAGPHGHHAEVEQASNRYVAGPYRTQARAQIAAESLANRVDAGVGHDQYQADSWRR